ncbi:type IV toxin-antitoxin system AbiEi family antitoxin domain-containing protein [Pseudonocardia halophobica]|uniref:Very-short-patch-repair endonuclease n=1 Tax=Pseudonocardia halophobica TaxID=29401 RepID=A0A9W6P0A2_9PSEU|nr:DUF559 domain-containing protein [Pseudonocardia halophobica]GLL15385.1 hypothetical protein GCM10017577_65350 [Pseudonocardia halophobica]
MQLRRVLERQAGVVSLTQAVACGLSPDVPQRRAVAGEWTRVHPAVYLVGGHRLTDAARVWAAQLWAGERAVVSGEAAAWCHGMLPRAPAIVGVTVPRTLHPRAPAGIRVRRRDLDPADVTLVAGLPVTSTALTTLETAATRHEGSVFLDRALQKHVRLEDLVDCFDRNRGARGWPAVRLLLDAAADGAESAAERLLIGLLESAGVDGWTLGLRVGPWTVDVAFPWARIAIEVDGWAWHQDVERFRADRRKQNALVTAGWIPLRFTWHDLHNRPAAVLREIHAALSAAA